MFDWDQEQIDLEREAAAPRNLSREAGGAAKRGYWWIVAGAVLMVAAIGVMAVLPAPNRWGGTVASLLSSPMNSSAYELAEIPSSLEVYDREVAIEVLVSLQRFSDEDLVTYIEATAASAFAPNGILLPYWNDALALAMSELSRRGMEVPQGLAPADPDAQLVERPAPDTVPEAQAQEALALDEPNGSVTN